MSGTLDALIVKLRSADLSDGAGPAWWSSLSHTERALIRPHMRLGYTAEEERSHFIAALERQRKAR